ncbi:MAG: hypothetical protein Crog4KO_09510 [Crocinitomicaceae bacterium]
MGVSCTVQKRVHRKGWYVEWNGSKHSKNKTTSEANAIQRESKNEIISVKTSDEISINAAYNSWEVIKDVNPSQCEHPIVPENLKGGIEIQSENSVSNSAPSMDAFSIESKARESSPDTRRLRPSPRVPTLAWALLIAGLLLLAIGVLAALIFAIINLTFIGLPFGYTLAIISGIIILILAVSVAFSNTRPQPSPPDPRYVKQEPKREKKERKPLAKNDKIFLAIIGGVVVGILLAILAF